MLQPRFAPLVFAVLMSFYMVSVMTVVITWVNTGLTEGFLMRWTKAFAVAWPVAFILVIFGAARIRRFVERMISRNKT